MVSRPILWGILALVSWYVLFETERILLFGHARFSLMLIDAWLLIFMTGLACGLPSLWPTVFVVGFGLNKFVVWINGGRMPVLGGVAHNTATHYVADATTRLVYLGDWIRLLWGGETSPGDLLMLLGWYGTMIVVARRAFHAPA